MLCLFYINVIRKFFNCKINVTNVYLNHFYSILQFRGLFSSAENCNAGFVKPTIFCLIFY